VTGEGRAAGDGVPQAERVRFLFDPALTLALLAGQRRRFAAAVAQLGPDELSSPSRCEVWSVADVLRHVIWADDALRSIWAGDRSLAEGFDPRRTPHEFVQRERAVPDAEVAARFCASSEQMATDMASAGPERFGLPALSPIGDVPWWLSSVHVGWDTAIHERDALLPLGRTVEADPEESLPVLAYSLVLSSFFAAPDPLHVRIGPVHLCREEEGPVEAWVATQEDGWTEGHWTDVRGDPVAAVDALSGRIPIPGALSGPPGMLERLGGLARYFNQAG